MYFAILVARNTVII